ncbi:cache domain-containing protein [Tritonibacter mobilis]|nr:cache domain-containing protein [Tritonibacter mobilis]
MNRMNFPSLALLKGGDARTHETSLSEDPTAQNRAAGWTRSLSLRLAVMLSIAMVPLGLIAVDQTVRLQKEVNSSNNLSLQALTAEFAQEEREIIKSAFASAETLALSVPEIAHDLSRCSSLMRRFISTTDARYSFAGFLPQDGVMACASSGGTIDYSENPDFPDWMRRPKREIRVNSYGPVAGSAVLIISEPVFASTGVFLGNQIIHVPHDRIDQQFQTKLGDRPLDLVTVSAEGEILSASGARETALERLPIDLTLSELISIHDGQIEAKNAAGEVRLFSIVPILSDTFYVIGSWDPEGISLAQETSALRYLFDTCALSHPDVARQPGADLCGAGSSGCAAPARDRIADAPICKFPCTARCADQRVDAA